MYESKSKGLYKRGGGGGIATQLSILQTKFISSEIQLN